MASHGKLGRPTVVEVVLGVHFSARRPLAEYIAPLSAALKAVYDNSEQLTYERFVVQLPADLASGDPVEAKMDSSAPDLPQVRFSDGRGMSVQFGDGIFTINCTDYRGFKAFFEHAEAIIAHHHRLAEPAGYVRIGLRYINLFPLGDPQSVFSWALKPPIREAGIAEWAIQQMYQQVNIRVAQDGFQQIIIAAPQQFGEKVGMSLDIDHFVQFDSPVQKDVQSLHQWVNTAHEHIWTTFKGALTETFFQEIQRDSSQ